MLRRTLIIALASFVMAAHANAAETDIEGIWLTGDGDSLVEISLASGELSGKPIGSLSNDPNRSKVDEKNSDPALRDRALVGLELFEGFAFDGDDRWVDGLLYDPTRGKTYNCVITVVDNDTLKVRGYVGIRILGRTETWTRQPADILSSRPLNQE